MANLTAAQKKQKKTFIALVIAIIVVAAAIAMVLFDVATAKSSLFENQSFAEAIAEITGTRPGLLSEDKLSGIKYLEINYDSDNSEYYVAAGKSDFVEAYTEYIAKSDAGEENISLDIEGKFKDARFEMADGETLADLKYFTGLEVINISSVALEDSAIFENMKALTHANVTYCGLTDADGFAEINKEAVYEINLSGNDISDWSPLDDIADKVIVSSSYSIATTEDGSYTLVPVEQTLKEFYEAEEAEDADSETDSEEDENGEAEFEAEDDGESIDDEFADIDDGFGIDAEDESDAE